MSPKVNITTSDGKAQVLLGNAITTLEDASSLTYQTNRLSQFVEYMRAIDKDEAGDVLIFYTEDGCTALKSEVDMNTHPIAVCGFEPSRQLAEILNTKNRPQTPKAMEKFLKLMRKYHDKAGMELYECVKNLKFSRVTKVEAKKDNRGNFQYHYTREGAGKDDLEFPNEIEFMVPLFKYDHHTVKLGFEVYFDYNEPGEGQVNMGFTLESFETDDVLQDARVQAIIESVEPLKKMGMKCYWGFGESNKNTDAWKYVENALPVSPVADAPRRGF